MKILYGDLVNNAFVLPMKEKENKGLTN